MKAGKVFDKDDAGLVMDAVREYFHQRGEQPDPDLMERIARAPLLLELAIYRDVPKCTPPAPPPAPPPGGWSLIISRPPDCAACDNTGWSRSASGRCSCPRGR